MSHFRSLLVACLLAALTAGGVGGAFAANPFARSGFELEAGDIELMTAATQRLYLNEDTPVGTAESWNNPESGNSGSVTLILKHEYKGLPCRRLQHDIQLSTSADPYRFIVDRCKTADGSWKVL